MSRPLNPTEKKLHQAALKANDKTLAQKDVDALIPDGKQRIDAINFLLSSGLFKALSAGGNKLLYRAVSKRELDVNNQLTNDESLILSYIQSAGNEGIWTKHIKVKTELHQTVIDRALKSLTQKQLIKSVSGSVAHPTRKMYMLFDLEPSLEVTGGPWYTDKELDTEFIKMLMAVCLKYVKNESLPRTQPLSGPGRLLYSLSRPPKYPSLSSIQSYVNNARVTETHLSLEHVETLMEVLILDGEIEKLPAGGSSLWDADGMDEGSESDEEPSKSKKRKRNDDDEKRKSKKRRKHESDTESDSDSEDDRRSKRKSKTKSKSKSSKSKKKKRDESDDESSRTASSDSEDDEKRKKKRSKSKSKKSKRKKADDTDDSSSEDDDSDTESDSSSSEDESRSKKKRSKSKSSSSSKKRKREPSSSPEPESPKRKSKSKSKSANLPTSSSPAFDPSAVGSVYVYRAIYPEKLSYFGWSQAPCGRCPTFEFCKTGGPVNPDECVYYGEWLGKAEVKVE